MFSSSTSKFKSARIIELFNPDETITTCPSINSARRFLKSKCNDNTIVYRHVAKGGGRTVDVMVPVEVLNDNGTRTMYESINEAAKVLGKETMEINTMAANGKANLGNAFRKVLTIPAERRIGLRSKLIVEILDKDKMVSTFNSVLKAAKALGVNHATIYIMVALGKAKLIYRAEEGMSHGALYQGTKPMYRAEEDEEVFYDALDQQSWMGEKEEKYYNSLVQQESMQKRSEEVTNLEFELLLTSVREMIHTGVFSQVLENSRETNPYNG